MATKKETKKKGSKPRTVTTTTRRTRKTAAKKGKGPRKKSPGKKAAKKRAVVAGTTDSKKESCFTIMPFGGYFDGYYKDIFRPAIKSAGLEPNRADDLYRPSAIVNDIWSYTKSAKVILADLTGKNPNVFYELGLAHALAKPAILVTESLDDIPFDLRGLRIIQYNKNEPDWGELLRDKIESSIKETLESPQTAVLPTFLNVKTPTPKPSLTPQEKEVIQLKQDVDMLQRELRNLGGIDSGRRSTIGTGEAEKLIRDYIELKVPRAMIEQLLVERGAPPGWVRSTIREMLAEKEAPSPSE
jgi:hypothetical protein